MSFPVPNEYDMPDVTYDNGNVMTYPPSLSGDGTGVNLSQLEKELILTLFSKAAYAEDDASTAYDTLESLWTTTTRTITYNLSNVSSSNTTETIESGQPYTTTLTPSEDYTLNGVTVIMGGDDVTDAVYSNGTITIPSVTGNIVITATAVLPAQSITATYTQTGVVYDTDNLDSLKADLVVTANYAGGTSETVPSSEYTLSGTLTVGTSTVTVDYAGLTDTFTVTVTRSVLLQSYDFTQGLTDSIGGNVATLSGAATQDSSGVHLSSATSYVTLPDLIKADGDVTIEFDIGTMSKAFSGAHGRLIMWDSTSGFIYRSTGSWQVYNGSSWETTTESVTDADYYANKTIKMVVGPKKSAALPKSDMEIIVDGESIWSKAEYYNTKAAHAIYLGQSATAFFNCTIKAVRVYEGVR